MRVSKKIFAIVTLVAMMGMTMSPLFSVNSSASSPNSCPSNEILRWTLFGGVPAGFNWLVSPPGVQGDYFIGRFDYWGITGLAYLNGTVTYNDSAVDWYSSNANYTQWEFNIKPGMTWSNGQPVTSQDILNTYSNEFALNATVDAFNLHSLIKSTYALNSSTAVFVLNQTDAHFADYAGPELYTGIYPASFIQNGPDYSGINNTATTLVSMGPFYPYQYTSGDTQMVLLRNPYFKPTPNVCEILVNFVEGSDQIASQLIGGTSDVGVVQAGSAASIIGKPNLHIENEVALNIVYMFYNSSDYPFNNLLFRQALVYGVNQTQIQSQAYQGYDTLGYNSEGGVPTSSTDWYNPNQTTYSYNPSMAISLLNQMGIKKGSDGYLQYPNGTDVSIPIFVANAFSGGVLAAGVVQANLEQLGFKITTTSSPIGPLIGLSHQGKTNGAIVMFQNGGLVAGMPYADALPGTDVYIILAHPPNWEPDQTYQNQYQGNLSAISATDVPSQEASYLNNIQAINSKDLPDIILGYPSLIYAYSTAHWTNWPQHISIGTGSAYDSYGISRLVPVTASASSSLSSTTSLPTSTSSYTSTSTSSASSGPTSTSSTSSSSKTSTGIAYPTLGLYVLVGTIMLVLIAFLGFRRWEKNTPR